MHAYIYKYPYEHTCTHVHECVHTQTHAHTRMYTNIHTHTHTCTHTCTHSGQTFLDNLVLDMDTSLGYLLESVSCFAMPAEIRSAVGGAIKVRACVCV